MHGGGHDSGNTVEPLVFSSEAIPFVISIIKFARINSNFSPQYPAARSSISSRVGRCSFVPNCYKLLFQ